MTYHDHHIPFLKVAIYGYPGVTPVSPSDPENGGIMRHPLPHGKPRLIENFGGTARVDAVRWDSLGNGGWLRSNWAG